MALLLTVFTTSRVRITRYVILAVNIIRPARKWTVAYLGFTTAYKTKMCTSQTITFYTQHKKIHEIFNNKGPVVFLSILVICAYVCVWRLLVQQTDVCIGLASVCLTVIFDGNNSYFQILVPSWFRTCSPVQLTPTPKCAFVCQGYDLTPPCDSSRFLPSYWSVFQTFYVLLSTGIDVLFSPPRASIRRCTQGIFSPAYPNDSLCHPYPVRRF